MLTGRHFGAGRDRLRHSTLFAANDASLRWDDSLRLGWLAVLLLAALIAFLPSSVSAQTFPKFTGLVVDDANVIPADRKAALEAKLAAFQQRTHRQLVVATIGDMQGYALADYGYRLGRTWGVGLRDVDNGAILFIAPNNPVGQRGPRIEVGRRLEPLLTDALSSVIVRTKMMPILLANKDVPGALEAGTDAIIEQLSLPDDEAKARTDAAIKEFDKAHRRSASGGGIPLGLIFWVLVAGFVILAMRRGRSGPQGPWGQRAYRSDDGGGGNGWVWLWAASELIDHASRGNRSSGWGGVDGGGNWGGGDSGGGSDGSWGGGGFTGGGGGDFGGGGASGDW